MCKIYYNQNKDVSKNNFNDSIINIIPKKRLGDSVNNIYIESLNKFLNKNNERQKKNKNHKIIDSNKLYILMNSYYKIIK